MVWCICATGSYSTCGSMFGSPVPSHSAGKKKQIRTNEKQCNDPAHFSVHGWEKLR